MQKMKNNSFIDINKIEFNKEFISNLIINNEINLVLDLNKFNLILLFKLFVFVDKNFKLLKINLKLNTLDYFNFEIFSKIIDLNKISNLFINLSAFSSSYFDNFINFLDLYDKEKLIYSFYFENIDLSNFDIEELKYFNKSRIISDYLKDRENKYPLDVNIISNEFLWSSKDFFSIINSSNKEISLYIHIPFCVSKCKFCCCHSYEWKSLSDKSKYLDKIISEINIFWENLKDKKIKNIFFWWWTPSIYSNSDLEKLFDSIYSNFLFTEDINISFEVTESSLNCEKIDFLKSKWVSHIFMWLQTINTSILKDVNRIQNIEKFKELAFYIKEKWIKLWIDIIVWLKWDNLISLNKTLNFLADIKPDSLQVCRFEHFDSLLWEYKNYISDNVDIFFNFAKTFLLNLWYSSSEDYDEIFYQNYDNLSKYDFDILNSKTDLLWIWASAKSNIVWKLKFENKFFEWYINSDLDFFSYKNNISILWKKDNIRNFIISNIDCNSYNIKLLEDNIINKDMLDKMIFIWIFKKDKKWLYYLEEKYKNKYFIKIIALLFSDIDYFEEIYKQIKYNNFIDNNKNKLISIWKKYDNCDNIYPIDPFLEKLEKNQIDEIWKDYLNNELTKLRVDYEKMGLYIHIPFCSSRCSFCSCKTWTDLDRIDKYIDNLIEDIDNYKNIFKWHKFRTVYFWWGTPWILNLIQLDKLFKKIYTTFEFYNDLFISFEATPYSLNEEKLLLLKKYKVNRLSIWIQSVDEKVLKNINRPQNLDYLSNLFNKINNIWFEVVSIDFVAWLEWETIETINKSLSFIKSVKPDTVYVYQYFIERSNSKELYDLSRIDEIQKIYLYVKNELKWIWYIQSDENDVLYKLNWNDKNNIHDSNLYKFNISVLALWEYAEWHIFWKTYYKYDNKKNILWKIIDIKTDLGWYLMKNLENWIDINFLNKNFNYNILKEFNKELSYLYENGYLKIINWKIYSNFKNHIDFISILKIFWPEKVLIKELLLINNNFNSNKLNDNINFLPIK